MGSKPSVLVTRLRYLGDVILSTPLLQRLRHHLPEAEIGYLVEENFAPALEECPYLDRLHVLPQGSGPTATLAMVRELRRQHYDWAIDLFGNPRSALLCALSGAHHRVGPERGWRSRLYQYRRGRPTGDRSAILHHLDKLVPLLESCGLAVDSPSRPPRLWLSEGEREQARRRLAELGAGPWIFLHPGNKWAEKAWPLANWKELARTLVTGGGGRVAVVQPPTDEAAAVELADSHDDLVLLPRLPLRQLFAVVAEGRLYIGNDGGVLHAAVALEVATLGLFGPTEPDIWFPYESFGPYRVLHRCAAPARDDSGRALSRLRGLDPSTVVAVSRELLAEVEA